jgi:hypothetical protein
MGLLVGNFLSALIIALVTTLNYGSLEQTTLYFLGTAYGLWILFELMDRLGRPKKNAAFLLELEAPEQVLYRHYHTAIDHPLPGQVYAGILNFIRVAGLVFTGLCLWKGLYAQAAGTLAFFLISANLIHRNHPWLFLGQRAEKGHPRAKAELQALEGLMRRRLGQSFGSTN